jgi:hypothetical protein
VCLKSLELRDVRVELGAEKSLPIDCDDKSGPSNIVVRLSRKPSMDRGYNLKTMKY